MDSAIAGLDDPLAYNAPSFNNKSNYRKMDSREPDSPRWKYQNLNEEVQTYAQGGYSTSYGVQASKRVRDGTKE